MRPRLLREHETGGHRQNERAARNASWKPCHPPRARNSIRTRVAEVFLRIWEEPGRPPLRRESRCHQVVPAGRMYT
jgi:hypothetical protein